MQSGEQGRATPQKADEVAKNDPQNGPARPQVTLAPVGFLAGETPAAGDDPFDDASAEGSAPHDAPSPALQPMSGPPAHLEDLAERARDYVKAASAANTRRAYDSDWKHFAAWCRRQGLEHLPSDPQIVGLYITACARGTATANGRPRPPRASSGGFRA